MSSYQEPGQARRGSERAVAEARGSDRSLGLGRGLRGCGLSRDNESLRCAINYG